jgi:hypothetical protein
MSAIFRVTLVQLKSGALAVGEPGDKIDLGSISTEEIFRLAGNLQTLDVSNHPKAEPGILVHRGDKGWRIAVRAGRLAMYKSTSLFDEFWTVESPDGLAQLPPFVGSGGTNPPRSGSRKKGERGGMQLVRTIAEVAGLFALGVVLIMVGLWYGLPHRKLSDLPADVIVVTAASEQTSVFSAVAGSYVTGKKPGDSIVIITAEGRVSLGSIGKDGKPAAPRIEEQAKAGRKGNLAVLVTSFGLIAEFPPDAVNVGTYRWRKVMTN